MEKLARMFKALSDETRVQIMALLAVHGELCVCDVEGVLGITQSKSSRHLRYLYHAGMVEYRRKGVWMHYRIPEQQEEPQTILVGALRQMLSRPEQQDLEVRLAGWLKEKGRSIQSCRAS